MIGQILKRVCKIMLSYANKFYQVHLSNSFMAKKSNLIFLSLQINLILLQHIIPIGLLLVLRIVDLLSQQFIYISLPLNSLWLKKKKKQRLRTSFRDRRAQSSRVSAASNLPCRLYKAPRFFKVVVIVGESTLAALCHPPYSPYGTFSLLRCLFSSLSSATCQMGLLSPEKNKQFHH